MKDVCAQIEDALERKRRGEICQEDYDAMKTQLKSQLPILTPHATFKNGRRLNADAIPSGLSIYDKDHIPNPKGYWEVKSEELRVKNPSALERILLVHVTPSLEGLRLVFTIPDGMDLAQAQKWMSEQLEDADYDVCVKDLARPSFIVPEEYILYINEGELFKEHNSSINNQNNKGNDETNRLSGNGSNPAVSLGSPAEYAQPADHNGSDAAHISDNGGNQSNGKQAPSKTLNQGGLHRTKTSGEGFDAPPTLERSGSERREGAVTPLPPEEERGLGIGGGALPARRDGEVEKVSLNSRKYLAELVEGVANLGDEHAIRNLLADFSYIPRHDDYLDHLRGILLGRLAELATRLPMVAENHFHGDVGQFIAQGNGYINEQ